MDEFHGMGCDTDGEAIVSFKNNQITNPDYFSKESVQKGSILQKSYDKNIKNIRNFQTLVNSI